ncbi:MAG: TIGR04282 family arsenosugar biosynthesis glycosyltransferase, partial [Burkholderiales bacterium]
ARLHARLVERALRTAVAARCGRVELQCAPRLRHSFFAALAKRHRVTLRAQGRGDLGARMQRAFERALRAAGAAVLIGSDCPALRTADLRAAMRALGHGADAVLAPAEDGGYALIGLRRASRRLFAGVAWGGADVLARTRRRLARLGWRWVELRTLWDVDRPEDYARLVRSRLLAKSPPPASTVRRGARRSAGSPARSGGSGRI